MDLEKRCGYEPTNRRRAKPFRALFSILAVALTLQQLIGQSQLTLAQPLLATGTFIEVGDDWRYFKGFSEASTPIDAWRQQGFDDSGWLIGPSGFGYGDGDDATILDDMQGNYVSLFIRKTFTVTNPSALTQLTLEIDYDDGFVAYLNGTEVARRQMGNAGDPVYSDSLADSHEAGTAETISLSSYLGLLQVGTNVLAIQGHNTDRDSSDFSLIPALRWDDAPPSLLRYPHIQSTTSTSTIIAWVTDSVGDAEVRYSLDQGYTNTVSATAEYVNGEYYYAATLTDLEPDTAYYYKIFQGVSDLALWPDVTFTTANEENDPYFNFVAFGDSRNATPATYAVHEQMRLWDFDLVVHTGDIVRTGTYAYFDTEYFNVYSETIKSIPFFLAYGNHDLGSAYKNVYYLPQNAWRAADKELYYSFDWGNAHFVSLDTNSSLDQITPGVSDQDMREWLIADLANTDRFWKFVFLHHPAYSSGHHGSDQRVQDNLVPVFEDYGVDIVFMGHDHDYERTIPILDNSESTIEDGGVVYFVTGGGGAPLYGVGSSWFTAYAGTINHFILVEVANCTLILEAIDTGGTVFDSLTIDRCNELPDLQVTKILSGTNPIGAGQPVTFTVAITNVGASTITTLPLIDSYDTSYLSYQGAVPLPDDNEDDGVLNWTDLTNQVDDLLPDDAVTVVIAFTTAAPTASAVNTATVQGIGNEYGFTLPPLEDGDEVQIVAESPLPIIYYLPLVLKDYLLGSAQ